MERALAMESLEKSASARLLMRGMQCRPPETECPERRSDIFGSEHAPPQPGSKPCCTRRWDQEFHAVEDANHLRAGRGGRRCQALCIFPASSTQCYGESCIPPCRAPPVLHLLLLQPFKKEAGLSVSIPSRFFEFRLADLAKFLPLIRVIKTSNSMKGL